MRTLIFALLALALVSTQAVATCQEVWDSPIADRPEITCAKFTDGLLFSLTGATKEQVIRAMNANGVPGKEQGHLLPREFEDFRRTGNMPH